MKKIFLYISFVVFSLLGGAGVGLAQTQLAPPAQVINTAGGSVKFTGGNYYAYNIGEPIVGTSTNPKYFTQGFLQPDYKIGTAYSANIYSFNESCQGANDGSIVANTYNNQGSVKYSLIPSPSSADTTSTIYNLAPGTYNLIITDSSGNSLTKSITILPSTETCPITIHHAFSPNGDGLNDVYVIDGIQNYPNNHVYIFNRWGQLIWDKAKYNNTTVVWDGKDNTGKGFFVDPGTYFYYIDLQGDDKKPYKGWVEVTK